MGTNGLEEMKGHLLSTCGLHSHIPWKGQRLALKNASTLMSSHQSCSSLASSENVTKPKILLLQTLDHSFAGLTSPNTYNQLAKKFPPVELKSDSTRDETFF